MGLPPRCRWPPYTSPICTPRRLHENDLNPIPSSPRAIAPQPIQRLVVLGATGSVGVNTLSVVALHPSRFEVVALSAHAKVEMLLEQCRRFRPRFAVVENEAAAPELERRLAAENLPTRVLCGHAALIEVATLPEVDTVMAAIVGAAGLPATLAAARAGKRVLLANKEAMVMAGRLFREALRDSRASLLPIDSEHNAILQS